MNSEEREYRDLQRDYYFKLAIKNISRTQISKYSLKQGDFVYFVISGVCRGSGIVQSVEPDIAQVKIIDCKPSVLTKNSVFPIQIGRLRKVSKS